MKPSNSFLDIVQAYLKSDKVVLPVFNQTGMRVQQEVAKEDPDVRRIEKIICSDQALTTQVLRTANSAFFRGLNKVNTIREAIIRLGTNEVANIVSLSAQQANFRSRDPFVSGLMKKLWQHSVICAIGAQWLARQLKYNALATEAFTAGLLHDIGKLLILKVIEVIKCSKTVSVLPSETFVFEVLSNLHAEQGYQLSKSWHLPDAYCHVIRAHHDAEINAGDTLLILVRMADKACSKMEIGLNPYPELSLETTPEANLLGLNDIFLARLEIQMEDSLALASQE
ncbi:MAG: HDOD domain-containing protein [Deltaproteobacteria bacterium]|nr:HDOD domain-containing protein [Deltaproteobacteria bacterium]